jgi:zinc transport system ATP-binding protein
MNDIHIEVQRVSFSYEQSHEVLRDVEFAVRRNEVVTIVGPNGGGKTTLLRLLLGLLNPDSGTILVNSKKPSDQRGVIGYVPQHMHFDRRFPMTVFDVVLSGLIKPFGFYSKRDRIKAERSIEDVGLSSVRNNHISRLSGGQMQRMLIARALVSEKEILLLDEPTASIDPAVGIRLNSLIKELSAQHTILLVTHDTGFVANITDRVFCVNGTLVEHPIDENFSEIIAASYGRENRIVRHDMVLSDGPARRHRHTRMHRRNSVLRGEENKG